MNAVSAFTTWTTTVPGQASALANEQCHFSIFSSDLFAFSESLTKNNKKGRVGWQPTVERYLEVIESLLRDAACLAMSPNSLLNEDMESLVSAWSQALYPSGIARMQHELEKTRRRMALNVNARLLMEPLLSQLAMELGKARRAT